MSPKSPRRHLERRRFLRRSVLAGTAAGIATALPAAAMAAAESPADAAPRKKGYAITEHVREYYRKAGF